MKFVTRRPILDYVSVVRLALVVGYQPDLTATQAIVYASALQLSILALDSRQEHIVILREMVEMESVDALQLKLLVTD